MATGNSQARKRWLRFVSRPQLFLLEDRSTPSVTTFGANPQHTSLSAVAAQPLQAVHWQTPVDNFPTSKASHYGGPLVTAANTVIYPYKTGTTSAPAFHLVARNGNDGAQLWDVTTDWTPTNYNWYPPYQPVLATATNRVYFAGKGGTIYYRDNPDAANGTITQVAFYGPLSDYLTNQAALDSTVFVDTPITADSQGNIYFGFRVTGANPENLSSGIARISAAGVGTWVSARVASGGDTGISQVAKNSAFALSNDESTLYLLVRSSSTSYYGRLVGLNATTLATQYNSGVLMDPRGGGVNEAGILSDSTASPVVGPDGKVFIGVFGSPYNGSRGWTLQFSADLAVQGTPGGFGWDTTPSIVPASMVPQYTGSSTYLLFTKYNNYYGISDGGDGSNAIAVLDPNDTEVEYHTSSNGQLVMKRILYKVGPTHDWDYSNVPTAVREFCINYGMVDPATQSVMVNCADGKFYRWHLPSNTLTETVQLTGGIGQPYTMTVIGMDGTVYGIQIGTLFAIGQTPQLSISDTVINEGAAIASFTVSLDYPRREAITVDYATANGSATAGVDYTATAGKLTFNPGEKTKTITVPIAQDALDEINETFLVNLSNPTNAVFFDGQGQATINDDDPEPTLSINDVAVNEGTSGTTAFTFTVNLSAPSGRSITVDYATSPTSAASPDDYADTKGTLTFDPGQTAKTFTVLVNGDSTFESNETFAVDLANAANASVADGHAVGTIINDDGVPSYSINDVSVAEGGTATFEVTLSNSSAQIITVAWATTNGTANANDYAAGAGTITFNPGQLTKTIDVVVANDALNELPETFFVDLSNPNNAFAADARGQATIQDDDPEPTVAIGDASVNEGAAGTSALVFIVNLSAVSGRAVTVNYATADGSALLANNDYIAAAGAVTFNPGETSKTITVLVNGDITNEPNEDLTVNLTSPAGATIADGQGTGTIVNDDALLLSIGDVSMAEGNAGAIAYSFTVNLSSKGTQAITVKYATADDSAASPVDYQATAGTLTFDPGETSKTVTVLVNGDGTNEANERFFVNLSDANGGTILDGQAEGVILNDDPVPSLTIADIDVPEGDYNTGTVNLYVTLSAPSGQTVTVYYETFNGTASSTTVIKDFIDTLGTVTFLPGQTVQSLQVSIVGDSIDELDETFFTRLSKATNATIADDESLGTIIDDDTAYISINNKSVIEGNSGLKALQLEVSLSVPSDRNITVDVATEDDTAIAPADYVPMSQLVTFEFGQTSKLVTVQIQGDTLDELDESFDVELDNATGGGVIAYYEATVTILDDDPGTPAKVNGVTVNGGAAQRSRVTTVGVDFDQFVTFVGAAAAAFSLVRQGDNAPVTLSAAVDNTGPGSKVTLSFVGGAVDADSLQDGRYTLTVVANQLGGLGLDGDGDGSAGDNYVLASSAAPNPPTNVWRLFGDFDGDNDVDAGDFGALRGYFGGANNAFDFDNDGDVDTSDFGAFRVRFGTSI